MDRPPARGDVRAIFISDVHLGFAQANVEAFHGFLQQYEPEHIYLVGDFIDGWRLKKNRHWPSIYGQVIRRLFQLESRGTRLYYTPGNHDDFLRSFLHDFKIVTVQDNFIHQAADGRQYLVIHGDQFDAIERRIPWLSKAGVVIHDWCARVGQLLKRVRPRVRSKSNHSIVRAGTKKLLRVINDFESRIANYAKELGCDGVICGHIHTPSILQLDGVTYCNAGDWIENCCALVEYACGTMQLVGADGQMLTPADGQPTTSGDEADQHSPAIA